jgi:hypothetical protein
MVKRFILSSILGVLTVSSAFALTPAPDVVGYAGYSIIIYKLSSIEIETPLTANGAQSAPVHQITGEASIAPANCLINGCTGMPKPQFTRLIFKSSLTDQNASTRRLFGACRRSIESANANDLISITGTFFDDQSGALEFKNLTDCTVNRPLVLGK